MFPNFVNYIFKEDILLGIKFIKIISQPLARVVSSTYLMIRPSGNSTLNNDKMKISKLMSFFLMWFIAKISESNAVYKTHFPEQIWFLNVGYMSKFSFLGKKIIFWVIHNLLKFKKLFQNISFYGIFIYLSYKKNNKTRVYYFDK